MKAVNFSTILGQSKALRSVRLALVAPTLVMTMSLAHAGTSAPTTTATTDPTVGTNWIGFTMGGAFVNGNDAGMQRRTQTNGDFYGGIDSFHFAQDLKHATTLTLDGHALPGMEDYEFNANLEKTDVGYVKAGYKQFRTWYDATGGYLQGANMIGVGSQFDDEQTLDRGEVSFEAGLRMENLPEITFSYRHLYRNGQKDSTSWGDTQNNSGWGGAPANQTFAFKLMPSLWNIDESTDIFALDVEHTLGNTDLGLGLVYERYELSNTRTTPRWGTNGAKVGVNNISLTEDTSADLFASNIHSVTRFNDKAWLSFAASYSSMNSDIDGGTRSYAYGTGMTPATTPARDYSYDQMSGGSNVGQFITNLNFMWVPVADLTVTPSLRYENESTDSYSQFRAYNSTSWIGLESLGAFTDKNATTEALDLRYTGMADIVLYAKGQWGQENEDVKRQDLYLPGEFLATDSKIGEQEYVLGANWYALRNLSFSLQGFHSTRDQSLDHLEGNQTNSPASAPGGANNFRPIMTDHNVASDDLNVRLTWRPLGNVSLVSRYDYRHTQIDNTGINWSLPAAAILYPSVQSGDIASHILSQSVTWSPLDRLYLQGSVSWVRAETQTPEIYTGASDNDYITGSLSAGYAIDNRTDLTASYTYYGANNYTNSVNYYGASTMGFGLNTEEHAVSLTLTRMLTPSMIWNLRYAFMTSQTDGASLDQSGGLNDYTAQMVSTGLQVRF